jgi:hypothetical protein
MWRRLRGTLNDQIAKGSGITIGTANVPSSLNLLNLMMEAIFPSKRQFLQEPYDSTSQKTAFLLVTAVKTSNLTCFTYVFISNFHHIEIQTDESEGGVSSYVL